MEGVIYNILTDHLTMNNIVLVIQLVLLVYIIHGFTLIVFRNWVEKYKALRDFRYNMILGIGSKVSIEAAKENFTGVITRVDKDNVLIVNDESSVMVDTRHFIRSPIVIHNRNI